MELQITADDCTPYSVKADFKLFIEELEKSSLILFKWLQTNPMKVNTLIYLALTGNTQLTSNIDKNLITSEKEQMLLGITIYSNLSFQDHINIMRKKASQKTKRPCIYRHTKKKNYNEINY